MPQRQQLALAHHIQPVFTVNNALRSASPLSRTLFRKNHLQRQLADSGMQVLDLDPGDLGLRTPVQGGRQVPHALLLPVHDLFGMHAPR